MPTDAWPSLFAAELARLDAARLRRVRRALNPIDAVRVRLGGRTLVNFSSNDYLGLTHHPRVVAAAQAAAARYGVGSGAAPLVTGHTDAHAAAEAAIAAWKGTAAAVLFPSGFQANLAIVQALAAVAARAGRPVRFLLDKLCHASLVDAARAVAAGASTNADDGPPAASYRVFPHNGVGKLARLLGTDDPAGGGGGAARPLDVILTESIFSMDGDAADLTAIAALKASAGSPPLLVLDEAHGSGAYGPAGAGLAAELGLSAAVDATVATLSKAVGVAGAAVCGSVDLCDVLVNLGRAYVFSTSVPATTAAAAAESIAVMRDEPHRQARVRALARRVRAELSAAGVTLPPGDSPIIPVVLGTEAAALTAADRLRERGLLVSAIRPPTVPRGTSRLRVTLSSEHSDAEVEALMAGLLAVGQAEGQPG
ncbi:MAG: 8-amino-7-oxononanoate synthase [Phycisphaerales bacterium]|nr:8-amino-7-oxononanoate synthase [Phycisphaerales bacterium]